MAGTYQFNIEMPEQVTGGGDGSGYPLQKNTGTYGSPPNDYQIHSTWMQVPNEDNHNTSGDHSYADTLVSGEVSMYVKHGDVLKVKVINPYQNDDDPDEVSTVAFDHYDGFAEPNPTSVVDPGGSNSPVTGWKDDGVVYSYSVSSSSTGWAQQYDTTTSTVSGAVNNSTSVTLSASNSGIEVDDVVTGTGISGTVSVSAIDGTSLTLSSAQTISNGVTLTFTRLMLSPARQVTWFFSGPPAVGSQWGRSARATFRLLSATLAVTATSVVQGSALGFSSSDITGLMASSGNKHNLYVSIFNSSNQIVTGVSWDSSSNHLGIIKTTDTSTVMTTGSSLPTGNYTAYLTHFDASHEIGNSGGNTGNRYYGSEHRLSSVTFSVTSSTGSVSALYGLGADIDAGTTLDYSITRNTGVLLMTPTTYVAPLAISGNNNIRYRRRNGSLVYQDADGGVTTAGATVAHGWDVTFYMTGPDELASSVTGYLTLGDLEEDLVISTGGGDDSPDDFDDDLTTQANNTYTNQLVNIAKVSDIVTLAGTAVDAAISVSGTAPTKQYRIRAASGSSWSQYTDATGTIAPGYQFQFRVYTSSTNSHQTTGTLTIGTGENNTGSIITTTEAGSGGGSGGGAGAIDYGLSVHNADQTMIFGVNLRTTNVVKYSSSVVTVPAANIDGYGNLISEGSVRVSSVEDIATNNADEIGVMLIPIGSATISNALSVDRGAGYFDVKNAVGTAIDFNYIVIRV